MSFWSKLFGKPASKATPQPASVTELPSRPADVATSHRGHEGPALASGMRPATLGWGPDDDAYPEQFVVNARDGAEMVWVPAGEFTMGNPEGAGERDEHPQHKVMLPAFWMDRTEVTNEQYGKFLEWIGETGDHSKCFRGEPASKDHTPGLSWTRKANDPKRPVVGVHWCDAYAYAAWARKRLPTEAEWEKAARGTDGRWYPWGDLWDAGKCNSYENGRGATTDVGRYPEGKSPYGCLDMAGNVWEWCADYYGDNYYQSSPRESPTGPGSGERRVRRGGCFTHVRVFCGTANRDWNDPGDRGQGQGFRCAVTP